MCNVNEKNNWSWAWRQETLKNLAKHETFHHLNKAFRSDQPVGIITPLENMKGCAVINFLSPKNHVFWAYWPLQEFTNRYFGCDFDEIVKLKGDFQKDMRQAKIYKTSSTINLVDGLASYFEVHGRKSIGYSKDRILHPEARRLYSTMILTKNIESAKRYLQSVLHQFGEYSFFGLDDRDFCSGRNYDHGTYSKSMGYKLFGRLELIGKYGEKYDNDVKHEVLSQLESVVSGLEAGLPFSFSVEVQYILTPPLSLVLNPPLSPNELDRGFKSAFGDEQNDPIHRKIISLRARLVRLLGWPVFYDDVNRYLNDDFVEELSVRRYNITEPYDVVEELEGYLHDMVTRYPILEV